MMAYFAKLILAIALILNSGSPGDYITAAANALQRGPVYVAPNTEGTDSGTAGKLQEVLSSDDNIVLVMLPADAKVKLGVADISAVASRLSDKLGKRIIGLAVGNEVAGYAPTSILPRGVAMDQMSRANNVSNDPITALITYAENMHQWEAANPQPTPSPSHSSQSNGPPGIVWFLIVGGFVLALLCCAFAVVNAGGAQASTEEIPLSPADQIRNLLVQIRGDSEQVNDSEFRKTLRRLCADVELYLQPSPAERDFSFMRDRLSEVSTILPQYIKIQGGLWESSESAEVSLGIGKKAIADFSRHVHEALVRGNDAVLLNYKSIAGTLEDIPGEFL